MMAIRAIIACLFVVSAFAVDPIVKIRTTDPQSYGIKLEAQRDQDITLSCYTENPPRGSQVRWMKKYVNPVTQQLDTYEIAIDTAVNDNNRFSVEKPTDYTWRLRIKHIQVRDAGDYICYLQLTTENVKQDHRQIEVFVPPYMDPSQTSSDTTADNGKEVVLSCNASGIPPPTIEWSRLGGAALPIGQEKFHGSVLIIPKIKPEHRGRYRCKVWNSIGTIRHDINLDVEFSPILTVQEEKVYQAVGLPVIMQCYIEANPLPTAEQMKWAKGSLSFSHSAGRFMVRTLLGAFNKVTYELIIDPVEASDYGAYSCQVSNNHVKGAAPTIKRITLESTDAAQPLAKFGRVLQTGELRSMYESRTGVAARASVAVTTLIVCLATSLLRRL